MNILCWFGFHKWRDNRRQINSWFDVYYEKECEKCLKTVQESEEVALKSGYLPQELRDRKELRESKNKYGHLNIDEQLALIKSNQAELRKIINK